MHEKMPCVKCREASEVNPPTTTTKQAGETGVYTHPLVPRPVGGVRVGGVPGMTVLAPSSCQWGHKACTHSSLPPHPVVLPSEVSCGYTDG